MNSFDTLVVKLKSQDGLQKKIILPTLLLVLFFVFLG